MTSRPSTNSVPASSRSSRPTQLSSVVFPEPLDPTRPAIEPASTLSVRPVQTVRAP
ncbi:Uncharacterised protein [Mycobacteroides abscessus]|nr:Uncharacterised protein [Mycobacteroides abscessus]